MTAYYFADWGWLFLLILLPGIVTLRAFLYKKNRARFTFSNVYLLRLIGSKTSFLKKHILFIISILILLFFILAMARPQYGEPKYDESSIKGVDIILLLDVSGSMSFVDGDPDKMGMQPVTDGFSVYYHDLHQKALPRLQQAKEVLAEFIERRTNDRVGLVAFSDFPIRLVPLTTSRYALVSELKKVDYGYIGGSGKTAIGDGIGMSMVALENSDAKTKIVILLTDGNSNKGQDPEEIAKKAAEKHIKIYSIGIGDTKNVLIPMQQKGVFRKPGSGNSMEPLQEDVLERIAGYTSGKFYRAANKTELERVYEQIDSEEKSIQDTRMVRTQTTEYFFLFLMVALALFVLQFVLRYTALRSLP